VVVGNISDVSEVYDVSNLHTSTLKMEAAIHVKRRQYRPPPHGVRAQEQDYQDFLLFYCNYDPLLKLKQLGSSIISARSENYYWLLNK
jgi:hypothetical protein